MFAHGVHLRMFLEKDGRHPGHDERNRCDHASALRTLSPLISGIMNLSIFLVDRSVCKLAGVFLCSSCSSGSLTHARDAIM